MDSEVENLRDLLKRSRLVKAEEVPSIFDRYVADAKDKAASSSLFARWLVQQSLLTEYQASLLAKGLVDDFFLGEYKILERVGRGRMAGVYKAERAGGSHVAIKVLPPSRTKIPTLMARFQREAALARRFNHPNVVRSLDVGETKGLHYLVMELLDGETVDDVLLRRKNLSPIEAVRIIHQSLLGLQHLHEHGVVHRDLKPSNLMLTPSLKPGAADTTLGRNVKILDIGLARKMFEESTPAEKIDPSDVTQEGVLLGTPDYLSPEQARDPRTIDIRSDIYSLGCVLFHLLVGQTPFPESNILNLMIRHATEPPRPLRDFGPGVPEGLQPILDALLAKKAAGRYSTPAVAAAALQAFLASAAAEATWRPNEARAHTIEETVDVLPVRPDCLPIPTPPPAKAPPAERVPTARALKRSAAVTRAAPLSKPHAPPPPLPDGIELVPLDAPAAPNQRTLDDWLVPAIAFGVAILVVAIAVVVTMILR